MNPQLIFPYDTHLPAPLPHGGGGQISKFLFLSDFDVIWN